jgi:hypothetical protein
MNVNTETTFNLVSFVLAIVACAHIVGMFVLYIIAVKKQPFTIPASQLTYF